MDHPVKKTSWKKWLLLYLLVAGCGGGAVMLSLNYKVKSQIIASSGSSASKNFVLNSSVGETMAGDVMVSANYTLQGGFAPSLNSP